MSARSIGFVSGMTLGVVLGVAGTLAYTHGYNRGDVEERLAALEARDSGSARSLPAAAGAQPTDGAVEVSIDGAPIRGSVDAPITLVEFSDFQCPFCARVQPTLERLLAEYPDQVRLVFLHLPLAIHSEAPLAHKAALAAERQGRFWEMHDRIFENPRALGREALVAHASALGLDLPQFERDLEDPDLDAVLARDRAESAKLGITGTPSFFLNGRRLSGAQPYQNFKVLIDRELARVSAETSAPSRTIDAS